MAEPRSGPPVSALGAERERPVGPVGVLRERPVMDDVRAVPSPESSSANVVVASDRNGLRLRWSITTRSSSTASTISIRPDPALRLPDHS